VRIASAVVAVPLLIVLLTWLSLRASNTDAEHFDRALGELDHFVTLEATLHDDVLSARAGMLRNYDSLVRETNALDASLGRLREFATTDAMTNTAIDSLATAVSQQEKLLEQFKSNNALLQNSLAYFGLLSSRLDVSDPRGPLNSAVSTLAAAMLRLTLDTSLVAAQEVQNRLDELARQPVPSSDAAEIHALLGHGRLLHDLLPATDGILKAMDAVPQKEDLATLRTTVLARESASRATANHFRLLLYITSLLLVALLLDLGLRLRARAWALRRRAAFEHVIAGISMRFINTPLQDLDAGIELALADMAECVGADRAYLLLSGPSTRSYTWCRRGMKFGPGWPETAPALVAQFSPAVDGIVHAPEVNRLPPGEGRNALAAAGLQGWACVVRANGDGTDILLGFDAVGRPCRITRCGELGLLRMALDAVTNAINRQTFERERARLETRLQQARHLETVGVLASGIAHNFNNIVGAILGYTEMADEQGTSDRNSGRILEDIRGAAERARELVDNILAFARRRDAQHRPVSMHDLVAEATSLLRASLPATVEVAVRGTSEPATVSGTPTQLQQVILNLCNNAAQAMGYLGRIEIETATVVIDLRSVRPLSHGDIKPGRYVRITVSDSGCGIDEAALERIFEPFFTTRLRGSGLGLATTRDIVREHGGAINVQSTLGVGSRFEIWLPRVDATASTPDVVAALLLGRGETVLLVEEDGERLLRDEEILAALGYEPVGFTRAADARATCREASARFDVVVVGHLASAMAALELAASLHEIAPKLPILLATASADEIRANSLIVAGVTDVVRWPIRASEIATALAACVAAKKSAGATRPNARITHMDLG
jgi:signal transduction histidine kinase